MKPLNPAWRRLFVRESNEIDPQPGFKNEPGSPRWDDHLRALDLAIVAGQAWQFTDPCKIHRILMGRMWPGIAGKTRTVNARVGSRICPPFGAVSAILDTWVQITSTTLQDDSGYLRAQSAAARLDKIWSIHIEFEKVHPFQDGNGRTGRMMMVNHALLLGVEPPLIRYSDRFEYYRRFE